MYSKRVYLKIMSNTCVFAAIIEGTVFRHIRSTISSTAIQNSINHFRDACGRYGGDLEAVAMHSKRVFIKNEQLLKVRYFDTFEALSPQRRYKTALLISEMLAVGMVGTWKQ